MKSNLQSLEVKHSRLFNLNAIEKHKNSCTAHLLTLACDNVV